MRKYDYTYIIKDNSEAESICEAAMNQTIDGGLVLVIIEGKYISINEKTFGENIFIYIDNASDAIVFDGCTFTGDYLSMENNGSRVLFHGCRFCGADKAAEKHFVRNQGYAVFDGCTFECNAAETFLVSGMSEPADGEAGRSLKYTVIMNSNICMGNDCTDIYIMDGDLNTAVLHTSSSGAGTGNIIWTREMVNENTFSYYDCVYIYGSGECGYEMSKKTAEAFNIRNLLSGNDNWLPCGSENDAERERQVFFISSYKNVSFTAGSESATDEIIYFPENAAFEYEIHHDEFVTVHEKLHIGNRISLDISGQNDSDETIYGFITFCGSGGVKADCVAEIRPSIIEPPRFLSTPEIIMRDGKAVVNYELDLDGRDDMSEISWYRIDNIDRTKLMSMRKFARSNEKNCRKIAVSRMAPCKEIQLTTYDIGRHLKVNIKPKHNRSHQGAGLNITSRIVMASDVKSQSIVLNMQNQVLDQHYSHEAGYTTVRGIWFYQRLPGCRHYGIVASSEVSLYFYDGDIKSDAMTVYMILDFENSGGEGFGSNGEYQEIYIKYDSETRRGYGIRYECADKDRHMAGFTLYRYDGTQALPISDIVTGCFLKSGLEIKLDINKNIFTAEMTVPDIDEAVVLSANIEGNDYSGIGIKNNVVSHEDNRVSIRHMEMNFPE